MMIIIKVHLLFNNTGFYNENVTQISFMLSKTKK